MRHRHVPVLALALALAATFAARADHVDDLIKAEMQSQNIPGLAIAVVRNGDIVKAQGYGFADVRRKTPATADTIFRIASVSKQFIAAGIMLLVQEGRLRLDDSVSTYLEETPAAWKPITVRHLLTHTSGIVREAPGFDPSKVQTDAAVIRSAYRMPLRFTPGQKHEYSNVGYFALAEIIRKASGRAWTEYLHETIFRPLGMTKTFPTNTTERLSDRAVGYVDNEKLLPTAEVPALRPSGAFLSTVLDMAKWDAALYTDKILSESTRRQMWTPATLNDGTSYPYGFGWQLESTGSRRLVFHGGGGPGARAMFARYVDDGLTIIVLINLDDVDVDTIVKRVAHSYLQRPGSSGNQ